MKHCLLLLAMVAVLALGAPAQAQYMYIDANGDGICTPADVLSTGSTSFDVWLDTDSAANGDPETCNTGPQALTINSYTIALSYLGGSMTYNSWADNMAFAIDLGNVTGGNEAFQGRGSGTALAPGLYKLGTYSITVTTGNPVVSILPIGGLSVNPTSFGTACDGLGFDNTYTLSQDWSDVCGTATGTPTRESTWGKIKSLYK